MELPTTRTIQQVAMDMAVSFLADKYMLKKKADLKFDAVYFSTTEYVLPSVVKYIGDSDEESQIITIYGQDMYRYAIYYGVYLGVCKFMSKANNVVQFLKLLGSEVAVDKFGDKILTKFN